MTAIYIFAAALFIIAYISTSKIRKRRERAQVFKGNWGLPTDKDWNWSYIRLYHDLWIESTKSERIIDDDTWDDLNMNSVFTVLDRTSSIVGQQYLYEILRRPVLKIEELDRREEFTSILQDNEKLRVDLQLELSELNTKKIGYLPNLFLNVLPEQPRLFGFFLLPPLFTLACIILTPFYPPALLGIVVITFVNYIIQYTYTNKIYYFTAPLFGLGKLLKSAGKIGKRLKNEEEPFQKAGKDLLQSLASVKKLRKLISNFSSMNSGGDEILEMIYESLNYIFLLEVNLYVWSLKTIRSNRKEIQRLFEIVGYLDSMISIASFKESLPISCKPTFTDDEKTISYKSIYHPFLEDPVPNDIHIKNKSILITGSNMAGKSTFLKTIGINQILSQTFYFCCASEATLSFSRLITSMRREDDITAGKSYYLTEVERIKELLNHAQTDVHNVFLIDEIFRGTNTVERVAASREVLMYLNNHKDIVIASTHDLELLDLLDGGFEFYHFREFVHDDSLDFDYKIREGATSTRNAIAILRLNGYPESLVKNAMDLSNELDNKN
ncbi:MAG TPA: hypothetical protein VKA34_21895 [Balneolales bacterium]|nr:hypothetical protein [Balneolales bacterium]